MKEYILFVAVCCFLSSSHGYFNWESPNRHGRLEIKMPGAKPTVHDQYLCTAKKLKDETVYVTHFEPHADANKAHHMLLIGCQSVNEQHLSSDYWDCGHHGVCLGMQIMFAWAKNAPPTSLPKDVGFQMGDDVSHIRYLILQVHYAHPLKEEGDDSSVVMTATTEEQRYLAGIYLLVVNSLTIPPHREKVHGDANCISGVSKPIHPFAFRVHAHKLGVVITGYKYDIQKREFEELARGNPHWPQAFYPMDYIHTVNSSDVITLRCTYNTMNSDKVTEIGMTSADEMCNLYLMYYVEPGVGTTFRQCIGESLQFITRQLPDDSDEPLPPNPKLEEHAHGHNSANQKEMNYNQLFSESEPVVDKKAHLNDWRPITSNDYHNFDGFSWNNERRPYNPQGYQHRKPVIHPPHQQTETNESRRQHKQLQTNYVLDAQWPQSVPFLGQVTGVSVNSHGDVIVFHRGNRIWGRNSFDNRNRFREDGEIFDDCVIHYDSHSGSLVKRWGKNMFFMPHGLTVDSEDNIWLTDVAMHQVFKFPPGGSREPLLTLGTKLEPGNDDHHFCKPAAVAVTESGEFFVADGYCNSRIIKYSADGQKLLQWGRRSSFVSLGRTPYSFNIPHSLTLVENENQVCVADRENGRIACFNTNNGTFHHDISHEEFGGRLFATDYSPGKHSFFSVNGPATGFFGFFGNKVQGFINDVSGRLIGAFGQFQNPHDIHVTKDGKEVYVVELDPHKIWRYIDSSVGQRGRSKDSRISKSADSHEVVDASQASSYLPVVSSGANAGIIIVALLAIPLLLIIIIMIVIRLRKRGGGRHLTPREWFAKHDKFSIGDFMNQHRGFEKVSTEESDHDAGESSESDVEEYNAATPRA